MNIKVSVSDKVEQQLTALGWRQDDILRDSTVSLSSQAVRPDVVLLYNVYPLSIIFYQSVLSSEDLDSLTITAMLAAEEIGVSCAYVTDGAQIFEIDAELSPTKRTSWPAPLELVTHLGYDTDDPRLFPPPSQSFVQLRLYQAVAVARALDALLSTKRTAVISMAVGSGLTVTAFQIAWKLLRSGRFKRLLFVGDAKYVVAQTKSAFAAFGEYLVVLQHWTTAIETASVHLVAADDAVNNETLQQLRALPENYYDVIVALDVQRIDENLQVILHQFPAAIRLAMTYRPPEHSTTQLFGPPVFSYSREDVLFDNPIQVPEGFHVVSLKEIATVTRGVNSHNFSKPSDIERKVPLILGQNIHPDGNIIIDQNKQFDLNAQPIRNGRSSFIERYILQENDILISAINSRIFNRIAIVTADLARQEIIFGSSLICVRVDPKLANPVAVYKFFRSDVGQIALQQQASQLSSNLLLSTSILAQIKIFLPPISELSQQTSEQLSGPANTLRQLQNEIIPDLEKLARVQMDNPNTAENPGLPLIADKLRQIANSLAPRSISEHVLEEYPTPIALAYRRFDDARFNIFEQVLRLRDLFEAISFFLYNVTLADSVRSPGALKLARTCKTRTAYDESSTAKRIWYVKDILEASQSEKSNGLFLTELTNTQKVTERLARLQSDFRNQLSHTATATETQQRRIVDEFVPDVKAILEELEFLSTYRLARIPAFYFKQAKLYRRMEVYQGVVPNLVEEPVLDTTSGITRADYNHLILINPDDQVLDLHPIYQLISNEHTRYETHICFLKQRKGSRLVGESVQGAFSIDLDGVDEFEFLRKKLIEDKPA